MRICLASIRVRLGRSLLTLTIISATHDHKMLAASDRVVWIRDGHLDRIERREDLQISVGTIE